MDKVIVPISDVKLGENKSDGFASFFLSLEAVVFRNRSNRKAG